MPKKYLIAVDDEQDLKFLFSHFFAKYIDSGEMELIFSDNAMDCLKVLDDIQGDILVITDINMPNMNGIELLREIRAKSKEIKVILTSAYDKANYIDDINEYNATGYISKPVDFHSLRDQVLAILDVSQ